MIRILNVDGGPLVLCFSFTLQCKTSKCVQKGYESGRLSDNELKRCVHMDNNIFDRS